MKVASGAQGKRKRSVRSLRAAAVLIFCLGGMLTAFPQKDRQVTKLQGRVYYQEKSETYPAAYVRLTLTREFERRAGKMDSAMTVYTGRDGWFYFTVVPGNYVLDVLGPDKKPVRSYRVVASGESTMLKIMLP